MVAIEPFATMSRDQYRGQRGESQAGDALSDIFE